MNENVLTGLQTTYAPGSKDRQALKTVLADLKANAPYTVLPNVDGENIQTGSEAKQISPFDHSLILANYQQADTKLVKQAIDGALEAKKAWSRTSLHDRAAIFYRGASLLQNEYRNQMMAATMIGQGKNAYQADIDCVAEVAWSHRTHPTTITDQ